MTPRKLARSCAFALTGTLLFPTARADVSVPEPPPASSPQPGAPAPAADANEQDEDHALVIEVRAKNWSAPRGVGDIRVKRELLDASPRQQTSELLSAAPGFFVDHEDGEGLGNDVYLRGFDVEHGGGIEMRVGNVPINNPVHVLGQGYADANFIIPEVVRSIRVLQGPYDPRQGDAAIVGSAYFDLGVSERKQLLRASYGSFRQARVVGVAAPAGFDDQTFAAFSWRKSDGFGARRASESGSLNAQYGLDLGRDSHLRLLATAYGVQSERPGVLREEDVAAGRIGLYERYPYFTDNQGVQASRAIISADFDTVTPGGTHFELAPWAMWTRLITRDNFTGNVSRPASNPEATGGAGDLWEARNRESALGVVSRLHAEPWRPWQFLEVSCEPGVNFRIGHSEQSKSLLEPSTLEPWDRRLDAGIDTLDVGAYLDAGLRLWRRARLSGGVRADLIGVAVDDRLSHVAPATATIPAGVTGTQRAAQGIVVSPRVAAEYDFVPELTGALSYGQGFRSLQATGNAGASIAEGARPFSEVRSYEAGFRARTRGERFTATLSIFEARVANELVLDATAGGFESEGASVRQGLVASAVAKPWRWLLASVSGSVSSSTFSTRAPGGAHYVPNVPPLLVHSDVAAHGPIARLGGKALTGRLGVGYTFLAGRHVTDERVGPADHVLNGHVALRYRELELGCEGYNLLARAYADDRQYYVSNWSLQPGSALATPATHLSAAPPLTVLATAAVFF